MNRSSTPRPVRSATELAAGSGSADERADFDGAGGLIRGVLEFAEAFALGERIDQQELGAAQDGGIELLFAGRIGAEGSDVRAGLDVGFLEQRFSRRGAGDDEARSGSDGGGLVWMATSGTNLRSSSAQASAWADVRPHR